MPLVMWFKEKGPIWTTFDRYFSSPDLQKRLRHKLEVLVSLHSNTRFTDFDRGPGGSGLDLAALKLHINRDWFGLSGDGSESSAQENSYTGAWQDWRGDAEGTVREALIRGIEVSLGLHHLPWTGNRPDPLRDYGIGAQGPVPRNWPMEFWASGPSPWLQASVTWRSTQDGGSVRTTWLLPAAGQRFATELGQSRGEFEVDPPNPTPDGDRNGSWIVGQAHTRPELGGNGRVIFVSTGATVVVKPTLAAGGVDPDCE